MKVLVVGSGGREHAVIRKLRENGDITEIYALPGNGGIAADAECVPIAATDIPGITAFAAEKGIEIVAACGELGKEIAAGAGERGRWFENRDAMIEALPTLLQKGDRVLVKASLGMHMEHVAEAVKELKA